MSTLTIHCHSEELLRGFKLGFKEADPDADLHQSVDEKGHCLVITTEVEAPDGDYLLFDHELVPAPDFKPEWIDAIKAMRNAGFAVVAFKPSEMGSGVDPHNLESCLVERGNSLIRG